MNRRSFLGQIALGSAFLTAAHGRTAAAGVPSSGLRVKFVGMMGFVERSDRSMLVAVPGHPAFHHYMHVPFLMARGGSRIATALGLTAMPGVVGSAFDYELHRTGAGPFVFRCLDGIDLDIAAAGTAVDNQATQLAQMHRIAPGKRLRGNLQRWSLASVALQGGQLHNAAGHPDAGRVFSFDGYQQPLTDAALYQAPAATVRLSGGREARSFTVGAGEAEELWVINAAADGPETQDPRRLEHGRVLFEYLVDATPIVATCPDAEGWVTPKTELPCAEGSSASLGGGAARAYPPFSEVCYHGFFGRG